MNNDLKMFVQFVKRDDDQKEVTGYASTEALDSQGEIVEKEAVAKALPAYLGDYDEHAGRYRFGNLREMHQLSAVGKTMQAKIDDKGLWIKGKVVDDNAWKKVKEGVYAGFSVGGRILKQIGNRIKDIKLSEISLVDRPANPEAVFAMVKADATGKAYDVQMESAQPSPETRPFEEIIDASVLLDMARNLRMLHNDYMREGRSVKELKGALQNLKTLAIRVLQGDDRKKFNEIFDDAVFMKNEMRIPTMPHEEVFTAGHILDLARDVRMLLEMFESKGKPTAELNRALDALKTLATKILSTSDRKKFDDILYGINFEYLDKAKLPFRERKNMPAGEFAYIDSKGGKHLPIQDKAHVKNAMARFNQTQFESPEKRKAAARKIIAAARKFGIEIDGGSTVAQAAKKSVLASYVNMNWTTGYFDQMKKVMG